MVAVVVVAQMAVVGKAELVVAEQAEVVVVVAEQAEVVVVAVVEQVLNNFMSKNAVLVI